MHMWLCTQICYKLFKFSCDQSAIKFLYLQIKVLIVVYLGLQRRNISGTPCSAITFAKNGARWVKNGH